MTRQKLVLDELVAMMPKEAKECIDWTQKKTKDRGRGRQWSVCGFYMAQA